MARAHRSAAPSRGRLLKIATYNVNGVNGRLPVLLRWLEEDAPDIVCLQELKTTDDKFPRNEIRRAGYEAVWHGQKSWNGVAILARGELPILTRRGLPGDPDDSHSRYIEAATNGLLIGDFNVMPTDLDVYAPDRWRDDALFRPEVKAAYADLVAQGWTDAVRHLHPRERIYTFWKYWRNSFERDAGLRIDHFLLSPSVAPWLRSASVRRRPRSWEHTSDHAPVLIEIEPPDLS